MQDRNEEIITALPRDLDAFPRLRGFRLRGLEMTRLESFVDAAFAFAVTMLVIAGQQVPDNVPALLKVFRHVPTFAASIFILGIFWHGHWLWSRRYGLEDNISIWISWSLIFTILVYVYPLKLVFGGMFYALSGGNLGHQFMATDVGQKRALFAVYAAGFSALALEIVLLNLRAWKVRRALQLNELEQGMTRAQLSGWSVPLAIGLTSLLLSLTLPPRYLDWSGWVYFSLPILIRLQRWLRQRRVPPSVTGD
jgi:hypothetical protein